MKSSTMLLRRLVSAAAASSRASPTAPPVASATSAMGRCMLDTTTTTTAPNPSSSAVAAAGAMMTRRALGAGAVGASSGGMVGAPSRGGVRGMFASYSGVGGDFAGGARRGIFGGSKQDDATADSEGEDGDEEEGSGEGGDVDGEEGDLAIKPKSLYHLANKPKKGVNNWRKQRQRAAFTAKNAREHKENKSARAKEREAKRLEKWRELAANARAWVTHKKTQEKAATRAAAKAEKRAAAAAVPKPDSN